MDDREASGERAETRVDPLAAFRAVVENLDQSYFVASADYARFHYVSPAAERLWGRPPDALVADPTVWLDWLHPDDRDEVARFVAEHAGAERYEREFRIVRPDGEVRWLLAKAFAWRAGEMPPLVIGYQQDITDRKERDLELQRGGEAYRAILDTAPDGFWEADAEFRIVEVNDAYVRMSGYSREELLTLRVMDLEAVESAADVGRRASVVVREGNQRFETKHRRKDGSIWDVEVSVAFRTLGTPRFFAFLRDISERKLLQESLRAERDLGRRYLDTVQVIIVSLDPQGRVTLINRKGCEVLGYRADELVGSNWFERCLPRPEGMAEVFPVFAQLMRGGLEGIEYHENEVLTRSGERRLVAWRNSILRDAAGRISGALAAGEDITERRRTEDAVKASERRFRDLVNSTDGIVWEADARDFRFTFVSEKAERLLGYPVARWREAGFWLEHLHPDDRDAAANYCAACTARLEPHEFEYRFIASDGRVVWLKDIVTVVAEDGRPRWLRGLMVDVTKVKEAESGLQLARQVFETAQEAIFVSDLDGRLLEVNPEACRLAGYRREEMLRLRNVDLVVAGEVDRIRPELARADRGEVLENRWLLRRSDGGTVPLDLVVQRLPGDRYLAIGRDLTEREKALREVAGARDEAQAASAAKSRFLAAASHDLRQPVQAINLLQAALARTPLDGEQRHIVDGLDRSVRNLVDILNALLDISRLDSGQMRIDTGAMSAYELFVDLDAAFAAQAAAQGLRFKLHFPFEDIVVETDRRLLGNLLGNLVANALRYTTRGGVLIGVRSRGTDALFQVWDSGVGIAPEHRERIFDEYFQIDNPQRDRSRGLGLGLAIVRRIAGLLGTQVTCRSAPGRGSVFEFRLPRAAGPAAVAPVRAGGAARAARLAGRRVALIEDDPLVADAVEAALVAVGIRVGCYGSAEDALADPGVAAFDVVVSDLMLPGMDGLAFLEALAGRSAMRPRAIVLTGDASSLKADQVRTAGWPLLLKPVLFDELLAQLDALFPAE